MLPAPSHPPTPPPEPVGWLERVRRSLRHQSRRLYRTLRHPRERRKGRVREWLGSRIHNRDLWRFRRHPVANGLAGGLFFSMLPLPMQSVFAAAAGIARGWNVPAAIAATWVSNPFTYVPMFLAAKGSISGIYHLLGVEPASRHLTPAAVKNLNWQGFWDLASHAGPELLLGYIIVGLICALCGYLLVHSFWWVVSHLEEPDRPLRRPRLREQNSQS